MAALVSYEDLVQPQRIRRANSTGGLTNIADNCKDSEKFARELDEIVRERT